MPSQRLLRILSQLRTRTDPPSGPERLCQVAADVVGASGAGIMLLLGDAPTGTIWLRVPSPPLNQGLYRISMFLKTEGELQDQVTDAVELTVQGGDFFGTGRMLPPGGGHVLIKHEFRVEAAN